MRYQAAIVGTGANPDERDRTGYAMAYRHAPGYERLDEVELVACADIVRENATAFAEVFDLPDGNVYEDYEQLLAEVDVDIVSVCTPPATHADIVVDCARSGVPDAVHCEKPMATTWGDCKRMVEVCKEAGVQLTVDHQRRFGAPFLRAKSLLDDGTVGDLRRIECGEANLFDAGVHQFDLCGFFTGEATATWMLGNVDYREENRWFGTHNETQGLAHWQYESGVIGIAFTGEGPGLGSDVLGCYMRLVGTDGVVELGTEDGPPLRYRVDGEGWTTVDVGETIHGPKFGTARLGAMKVLERIPFIDESALTSTNFFERAIEEVVDALATGREPSIAGKQSLRATELAFAAWESARRQGRVELPLEIDDNPLEAMVEQGIYDVGSEPDGDVPSKFHQSSDTR